MLVLPCDPESESTDILSSYQIMLFRVTLLDLPPDSANVYVNYSPFKRWRLAVDQCFLSRCLYLSERCDRFWLYSFPLFSKYSGLCDGIEDIPLCSSSLNYDCDGWSYIECCNGQCREFS